MRACSTKRAERSERAPLPRLSRDTTCCVWPAVTSLPQLSARLCGPHASQQHVASGLTDGDSASEAVQCKTSMATETWRMNKEKERRRQRLARTRTDHKPNSLTLCDAVVYTSTRRSIASLPADLLTRFDRPAPAPAHAPPIAASCSRPRPRLPIPSHPPATPRHGRCARLAAALCSLLAYTLVAL